MLFLCSHIYSFDDFLIHGNGSTRLQLKLGYNVDLVFLWGFLVDAQCSILMTV